MARTLDGSPEREGRVSQAAVALSHHREAWPGVVRLEVETAAWSGVGALRRRAAPPERRRVARRDRAAPLATAGRESGAQPPEWRGRPQAVPVGMAAGAAKREMADRPSRM